MTFFLSIVMNKVVYIIGLIVTQRNSSEVTHKQIVKSFGIGTEKPAPNSAGTMPQIRIHLNVFTKRNTIIG